MTSSICAELPVAKDSASEDETGRERLDLRIPPKTRKRADRQRLRFSQSLSAYIRQALIEKLERDEKTDPGDTDE